MPLPIETPAPKASSLIKRFQQTIDNLDGPQALPLPRPRLSQDPEEVAQNRKSWSVGSGGAPITINQVLWNPNQDRNHSRSNSTQLDRPASCAVESSELESANHLPKIRSRLSTSNTTITTQPDQLHPSRLSHPSLNRSRLTQLDPINQPDSIHSNLNSLLTPTADQPIDLSRLNDLSKSDLAVQSPPPTNPTHPIPSLPSSSPSLPPPQSPPPSRRVKASISADSRAASARARKQTNVTAPTAASLAKMRATEGPRSVSQPVPKPSTAKPSFSTLGSTKTTSNPLVKSSAKANEVSPKTFSHRTPTGVDPRSTSDRQARIGPTGSNQPTRVEYVRPATPVTSNALRKAVMAKTKAPPLPTFNPKSALGQSDEITNPTPIVKMDRRVLSADPVKSTKATKSESTSTTTNKSDKRPLQRARVASVATPISGIKKPLNPNPSSPSETAPKLRNSGGPLKPSDSKASKPKPQSGSPKVLASAPKKSSKSPRPVSTVIVPFPEQTLTSTPEDKDPKPSGSLNPGQITPQVLKTDQQPLPVDESQQATCPIDKAEKSKKADESKESHNRPERSDEHSSNESDQANEQIDSTQVQQSQQQVFNVMETEDQIDNQMKDEYRASIKSFKSSPLSGHNLGLTDDEDHFKGDIDASTTNTDGDGEQ